MRQVKSSKWYEARVKYTRPSESGDMKEVVEKYAIAAMCFSEAENSIIEEILPCCSGGDVTVLGLAIAKYSEVWYDDREASDKFYKVQLQYIAIDEVAGKEKKTTSYCLIQASSIEDARLGVEKDVMGNSLADYTIVGIQETMLMDCFGPKKV